MSPERAGQIAGTLVGWAIVVIVLTIAVSLTYDACVWVLHLVP